MKPIKLLLSLIAMLVVTVGAWGQSLTSAPTPIPAGGACGGSSTGTPNTVLTLPAGCTSAILRLDILNSVGGLVTSGATISGTPGAPGIDLPAATFPNTSGNYSLQATIVSVSGPACTPGAFSNGNSAQFAITAVPNAPTLTGTPIPTVCVTSPNVVLPDLATDGVYATCNGVGTLVTTGAGYTTITATAPTRNITFRCNGTGGCNSTTTTLAYTVTALPGSPTSAGTLTQQCINTLPILSGATCPAGSEPVLIIQSTGAIAQASDFPTTAVKSVATACRRLSSPQCIDVAAAIYPTAAAGSPVGGNGYFPVAIPTAPTAPLIAAYKPFPATQISNKPGLTVTNVATVCSADAGTGTVVNFAATCATGTAVVYDAATGGTPVFATAAITIGAVVVPTTPITAPAASMDYYIACNSGTPAFCESTRVKVTYTLVTTPAAPVVSDIPTVCDGSQLSAAALRALATCATGTVTLVTGNDAQSMYSAIVATNGVVASSAATAIKYTCVLNGCASSATSKGYTILPRPAAPSAVTMLAPVCEIGGTGAGMMSIATHNCPIGSSPYVTSTLTGSTKLGLNGALFSQPTGSTIYTPFCQNDAGCSSVAGAPVTGVVTAKPITPFNLSLSYTGISCPTAAPNNNLIINGTCTGALTEQLDVYTTAVGGTKLVLQNGGSNFAEILRPTETTSYFVECRATAEGCLSDRVAVGTFTVGTGLAEVTLALTKAEYCLGETIEILSNNCPAGTTLRIYDAATGNARTIFPTATPLVGNDPVVGTHTRYAVCRDAGGCESIERTPVTYKINALPARPIAGGAVAPVCALTVPTAVLVGATPVTCEAGSSLVITLTDGSIPAASIFLPGSVTALRYLCKNDVTGCISLDRPAGNYTPTAVAGPNDASTFALAIACEVGSTAAGMTNIATHSCPVGSSVFVSTSATGSPVLGLNGAPFSASTTSTTYYAFCRTDAGCLSVGYMFTYNAQPKPIAPFNLSLSKTSATCPTAVTNFDVIATCTGNTTEFLDVYTVAAGGTRLKREPAVGNSSTAVTIGAAIRPTETTTYYVECVTDAASGACKSDRVMVGTYTVGPAGPAATITLTATTVCAGTQLEIASSTCPTGGTLTIYQDATGAAVWTVNGANKIQGAASNAGKVGNNNLYVTCTVDGCESGTRTAVPYTVVPNVGIAVPNIDSPAPAGAYCSGTEFTLRGNCAATDTKVIFYDFATSTVLATLPVVDLDASPGTSWGATYKVALTNATAANKDYDYRVKCSNDVCESALSAFGTITIRPDIAAPVVTLSPAIVCGSAGPTAILSSSTCGVLETVWYNATTNTKLASLPALSTNIPGTYSYYAKCKRNAPDCESPASNIVSYTVTTALPQPTVTSSSPGVACSGSPVTFTSNCPVGSTPLWTNVSTGVTSMGATLVVTLNNPGSQTVTVKCTQTGGCDSPVSASATATWSSIFDLTIINIGASKSGIKPGAGVPKSAWASNFVTVDAGAPLLSSTQANPSIFYTENPNKVGPRFWTIHVETCAFGTDGAISYDMLVTPETGPQQSFNTVENNAPYLMYANRDGFTELYAQNNPFFGFFADNGSGGNKYDAGLPKGLYKLSIRYWSQKGLGIAPAVRVPQGAELAYQEHWFRIQSMAGIGGGSGAREGVSETSEVEFATVAPNPVTRTLTLAINGAKGQEVKMNLVDAAGRIIKSSTVTPETNTHREEVDMSTQTTGMYFMNISTPTKRANLKVLKVSND